MNQALLDTNILSYFLRGDLAIVTKFRAYRQFYPIPDCSSLDILDFLMTEYELTPLDFPEIGTEETVSEIFSGKRELTMQQIRALSKRFNISPAVFIL